ncbi:MAG: molybdopterin-dependent oxidoreductase, partial [Deltaproteobacteria bacterium]|nr:molybdopterin-dependent oxidoreductase [Deltaproteobacteria bacterium]
MSSEKHKNPWLVDRRSFLKTAGAGLLGVATGNLLHLRAFTLEEALASAKKEGETVVPTFCGMCGPSENCGVYAFVKDGRFTRVAGMKESPVNRGSLCSKGQAAPQWVYSPDRLKYPLKRTGKKGEGKFERIGWDDALKIIADTLKTQKKKYGPESLAMLSPARRTYSDYMQRFLIAHGSPNYGHSGICAMQRMFAFSYTLGGSPSCDYENAEVILIWAKQPFFSGPAMDGPRSYLKAKQRGAKIISIKPSVEPDVSIADIWVPVRPGTDTALALSMLNVIINEDLYDKEFVEKYCYGFDKLKEHVQKHPPEWGERVSGVPAGQIIEVSRIYAKAKSAAIDLGNGVEHTPSSNDAIRAVAILMAITGNLNRKGGNKLGGGMGPGGGGRTRSISLAHRYTQDMVNKLVGPEFPIEFQPFMEGTSSAYYKVIDSVLTEKPYPIRTIIAPGTQPAVSTRGAKRVIEALKKVDFYVVVDVARTADMDYADIVVPVATPYEIDHPFGTRGNMIVPRNRVIEPLGEYKSIFEFFIELGAAMGYGADFWNGSITECMNYQLEPLGITFDELKKHPEGISLPAQGGMSQSGAPGDATSFDAIFQAKSTRLSGEPYLPHGKVEIYNTTFEAAGYNPLPEWREPPESITGTPELTKKYPLILSDYHTSKCYNAAWQRNVPVLREIQPYPVLHIHPDTATERGIKDSDWIIVESPHGWIKIKAELYPGIRPDTVMMLHGWWQGCKEL